MNNEKIKNREKRKKKIRVKIWGTSQKPRLAVFRSNLHIYGQIINDDLRKTIVSISDLEIKKEIRQLADKKTKQEIAFMAGVKLSQKAEKKKISRIVFDRGGFKFHGRIRQFAQGARKAGLKF